MLVSHHPSAVLTEINYFLVPPPLDSLPLDFVTSEWLSLVCLGPSPHPWRAGYARVFLDVALCLFQILRWLWISWSSISLVLFPVESDTWMWFQAKTKYRNTVLSWNNHYIINYLLFVSNGIIIITYSVSNGGRPSCWRRTKNAIQKIKTTLWGAGKWWKPKREKSM